MGIFLNQMIHWFNVIGIFAPWLHTLCRVIPTKWRSHCDHTLCDVTILCLRTQLCGRLFRPSRLKTMMVNFVKSWRQCNSVSGKQKLCPVFCLFITTFHFKIRKWKVLPKHFYLTTEKVFFLILIYRAQSPYSRFITSKTFYKLLAHCAGQLSTFSHNKTQHILWCVRC